MWVYVRQVMGVMEMKKKSDSILWWRCIGRGEVIGLVPAFGLVGECSSTVDIRHFLLGHVCPHLGLQD